MFVIRRNDSHGPFLRVYINKCRVFQAFQQHKACKRSRVVLRRNREGSPRPPHNWRPYLADSMETLFSRAKRSPPRTPASRSPSREAHSAHAVRLVWARSSDRRFHQRPRR